MNVSTVEDINSALAYDRIEILHGLGYSGSNTTRSAKKGASDPKLLNLGLFFFFENSTVPVMR